MNLDHTYCEQTLSKALVIRKTEEGDYAISEVTINPQGESEAFTVYCSSRLALLLYIELKLGEQN